MAPAAAAPYDRRLTALVILWNVVSSLACIFLNKMVFLTLNWPHGAALTAIHFYVTFLGVALCAAAGLFEVKRLPLRAVLGLSVSFSVFIVTMNLSLRHNSVGFYQLSKVVDTPVVYFIQSIFYHVHYGPQIKLSLVLVMLGVLIVTTTAEMRASWLGLFFAASGVTACSLYQVWVGTKQTELSANSMQLLLYQAPISALLLTVTLPLTEDLEALRAASYPGPLLAAILLSSLAALCVNVSVFTMIGRTSAMVYNVLGHAKFVGILIGGFLFFGEPVTSRVLLGVALTCAGLWAFSYYKLFPPKAEDPECHHV